jgi:transcriptional regulator GlxA family with amidase domain
MSQEGKLTVGILIFDGVEVLDFGGPFEVFSGASTVGEQHSDHHPLFQVVIIAEEDRIITCAGGLLVKPQATIKNHPPLDILVVPGGDVSREISNPHVLEWISQQDRQTRLTTSVCTGAYLLAESGLLNQHRATTHWAGVEDMRKRYPAVEMLADTRIVDEGHIITSAGVSSGIDMSLHVVSRLYGEEVAAQTARYMEYDWSARSRTLPQGEASATQ